MRELFYEGSEKLECFLSKTWFSGLASLRNLALISQTHRVEGENQLPTSCPLTSICRPWCEHTPNTDTLNK